MYSRQNRNGREEISVELPRDYSGNAFSPFPQYREPPMRDPRPQPHAEEKREEEHCEKDGCKKDECKKDECKKEEECCKPEPIECTHGGSPGLAGLKSIFGGNIGLEELLLLGVIFLIFSDDDLRDNELLICLLLILFI